MGAGATSAGGGVGERASTAAASSFDAAAPPSRCADGVLGEEGKCSVPASRKSGTWLQLNLREATGLHSYRLTAMAAGLESGVEQHEVVLAEEMRQERALALRRRLARGGCI